MPALESKSTSGVQPGGFARRVGVLGALLLVELAALSAIYTNSFEFTCRAAAPAVFCGFMSLMAVRAVAAAVAIVLLAAARPAIVAPIVADAASSRSLTPWAILHILGVAAVAAPWFFLGDDSSPAAFRSSVGLWLGGAAVAGLATLFLIARPASWRRAARAGGWLAPAILAAAIALPDMALLLQTAWTLSPITDVTFAAVAAMLHMLGETPVLEPAIHHVGLETFSVLVGPQCSGIEGFGLITAFLLAYIGLFRRDLRFPNVLLLLPVGLALSWTFNVFRITALIEVGAYVSKDLAVDGFHSHAGWLLFSTLAIGLMVASRQIAFFRAEGLGAPRGEITPVAADPAAAQLLPFAAFMFMGLIVPTLSEAPATLYPLAIGVTFLTAAFFWRVHLGLPWRVDWLSIAVGLAIGGIWIAAPAPAPETPGASVTSQVGGLGATAFAIWAVVRVLGTSLVVPLVEEMFFRGYLLRRLAGAAPAAPARILIALAVSSALFAILHDRWALAALAGVAYGLLALRAGRVTDAIQAHIASNLLIAIWAVSMNDWDVI